MKKGLLIVTQVMDERDPILGFFVSWVRRLAEGGEPIVVACWRRGTELTLPPNVRVIGMPRGAFRRSFALMRLTWQLRRDLHAVFVHMIPPVVVALGWFWRLFGLRVVLWYTHGTVTWMLRVSSLFVHEILTATPESCRLKTPKKRVVGHGIDLAVFRPSVSTRAPLLLSVGRLSPRKDLVSFLTLCAELRKRDPHLAFRAAIVGEPSSEGDRRYEEALHLRVAALGLEKIVTFHGPHIGESLVRLYSEAALFVSTSRTGSLDKVVLEALACETPALCIGESYRDLPGVVVAEKTWDESSLQMADEALRHPQAHPEARAGIVERAELGRLIQRIRSRLLV